MTDDKTAAERAAEERYPLPGGHAPGLRGAFVAGATWQAEQSADRRVAPDRETLETALAEAETELLAWCSGKRSWINEALQFENSPESRAQTLAWADARDADNIRMAREKVLGLRALIASGVLGVPADSATSIHSEKKES